MSVTLTHQLEERIQHLVGSGRYPDADTVIAKALEALEAQEQERFVKLRELVLAGFSSPSAGELTEEMWDEIERSSEERFQRGEEPSPHVVP